MHPGLRALLVMSLLVPVATTGCQHRKKPIEEAKTHKGKHLSEAAREAWDIHVDIGEGIDPQKKQITLGVLTDKRGPAKRIGQRLTLGPTIVARMTKQGKLLPRGWKLHLKVEGMDYDPVKADKKYEEMHDDVLFFANILGSSVIMHLLPKLRRDKILAFPGSQLSDLVEHPYTPRIGPSYKLEAERGFDWAIRHAHKQKRPFKPAIVWQFDDYGNDAKEGWKQSATLYGVDDVAEPHAMAGQLTADDIVDKLEKADATYVMLAVLPETTAAIMQEAANRDYHPIWLGNTPSWDDVFFRRQGTLRETGLYPDSDVAPTEVINELFNNYYWVTGFPYWGEDVPGMKKFEQAFHAYLTKRVHRDFYVLLGYIQGLLEAKIISQAIEQQGALTRDAIMESLHNIRGWDAGGMLPAKVDLSQTPYVSWAKVRVLKPLYKQQTWKVVGDWAEPAVFKARTSAGYKPEHFKP